jgi:hypothetical protein
MTHYLSLFCVTVTCEKIYMQKVIKTEKFLKIYIYSFLKGQIKVTFTLQYVVRV